jgi:hypothetical protein
LLELFLFADFLHLSIVAEEDNLLNNLLCHSFERTQDQYFGPDKALVSAVVFFDLLLSQIFSSSEHLGGFNLFKAGH